MGFINFILNDHECKILFITWPFRLQKNTQNIFSKITASHNYAEQLTTKDSLVLRNKNSSHIIW